MASLLGRRGFTMAGNSNDDGWDFTLGRTSLFHVAMDTTSDCRTDMNAAALSSW